MSLEQLTKHLAIYGFRLVAGVARRRPDSQLLPGSGPVLKYAWAVYSWDNRKLAEGRAGSESQIVRQVLACYALRSPGEPLRGDAP